MDLLTPWAAGEQKGIYGGMRAGYKVQLWELFWPPSWQSLWTGGGLGRHRSNAVAATWVSSGTRRPTAGCVTSADSCGTGCLRAVGQDLRGAVRSRLLMPEYVDVGGINNRTAALWLGAPSRGCLGWAPSPGAAVMTRRRLHFTPRLLVPKNEMLRGNTEQHSICDALCSSS